MEGIGDVSRRFRIVAHDDVEEVTKNDAISAHLARNDSTAFLSQSLPPKKQGYTFGKARRKSKLASYEFNLDPPEDVECDKALAHVKSNLPFIDFKKMLTRRNKQAVQATGDDQRKSMTGMDRLLNELGLANVKREDAVSDKH